MKSNKQLIDEYLSNGGKITICPSAEPSTISEPIPNSKLIPTETMEYDYSGRRVYKNLNRFDPSASLDETIANYG